MSLRSLGTERPIINYTFLGKFLYNVAESKSSEINNKKMDNDSTVSKPKITSLYNWTYKRFIHALTIKGKVEAME